MLRALRHMGDVRAVRVKLPGVQKYPFIVLLEALNITA
jgi:hypothetical protein